MASAASRQRGFTRKKVSLALDAKARAGKSIRCNRIGVRQPSFHLVV
jgi:hypothetical protein